MTLPRRFRYSVMVIPPPHALDLDQFHNDLSAAILDVVRIYSGTLYLEENTNTCVEVKEVKTLALH